MRFVATRDKMLKTLQLVVGAIEQRQTMPILSNVLLVLEGDKLSLTSTDLELELTSSLSIEKESAGKGETPASSAITIPGRKALDIFRVLPGGAAINLFQESDDRVIINSGRSRFALSALSATGFPSVEWTDEDKVAHFKMPQSELRHLIASTHFAMAQQDVRIYLNGLLLDIKGDTVWAAATDGHRLALNSAQIQSPSNNKGIVRAVIPRRGVTELVRLLGNNSEEVDVYIGKNHIRVVAADWTFISKLIDGKFPDYRRAIPSGGDKQIIIEREVLKDALTRVAILSNDVFRGIELKFKKGAMELYALNQEHETAEEEVAVEYQGEEFTIGFNATYLLDIANNVQAKHVVITAKDSLSSVLIEEHDNQNGGLYVVMPLHT